MVTAIFFQIIESLLVEFSLGKSFLGGTMFLNYFLSKSCYMIMYDQCKLRGMNYVTLPCVPSP